MKSPWRADEVTGTRGIYIVTENGNWFYKAERQAARLIDSEMRFAREIAELSKSLIWVTVPMQGTPKKASEALLDWLRPTAASQ